VGYKSHDDITKRLLRAFLGISSSLPLRGWDTGASSDGVYQAYGGLGVRRCCNTSGLLLRLYDTQHSEEDGVFFCVALLEVWSLIHIRDLERYNFEQRKMPAEYEME
jgi:hypothetical protein